MLLVGDIGGTNTRLALFSDDAKTLERSAVVPSAAHKTLGGAVEAFLAATYPGKAKRPKLRAATFGVAGPVLDGKVKGTNFPWVVDARVLAKELRLPRVGLLNDLVALALGAVAAPRKDLHLLQGTKPPARSGATVVVIAVGTGLGEAALVWDGTRLVPCGTEGGHSDFAARSEVEWELREFIAARVGGRVSCERVLSGPGIGTVYDFFREGRGVRESAAIVKRIAESKDKNAAVASLAETRESKAAVQALDLFASLYGAEAGNLALKYLAVGGVFVAGHIAASMIPRLERQFVPAFGDKGRFSPLLRGMPVAVVKNASIGLYGSARHAAGLT